MSTNGPRFPHLNQLAESLPEQGLFAFAGAEPRVRHRYWLHALLLLLTLVTTTVVGAGFAESFRAGTPLDFERDLYGYVRMWSEPAFLLAGLPFSLTLLSILLAHEFGHYLAARYYGVGATLPYFLPAPTLIGTMGAFIRIKSVIYTKRILFDIGVAGPLAGFAVLLPVLLAGVAASRVAPGIEAAGDVIFGTPLLLRAAEWLVFPGVAASDIYLHPVARAAWVGLLATALNLLPIGQLDGGHILYSFLGEATKYLSRVFVAVLVGLGLYQLFTTDYQAGLSWLVWAVILLFVGMRHPSIVDPRPMGRARAWLAVLALVIFVVSFTPAPVRPSGL